MLTVWGKKKILFLMATELEYGEHLKQLMTPVIIGIGPVEAAVNTTAVLAKMREERQLPDLVISLGSAGSAKLHQTGIYQVSSVGWRDMDASALGVEKGVTPFLDMPAILPMKTLLPNVSRATLSTGGNVVSGADYQTIDADMVDMETYAVLRACQHFGVELFGLRGISDGSEDLKHAMDWRQFLHVVDKKLAQTLQALKQKLIDESQ